MGKISQAELWFGYELIIQPGFNPRTFAQQLYDPETKFKPELFYSGPTRLVWGARAAIGVPVLGISEFAFGYASPLSEQEDPKNLEQKITIQENADGTRSVINFERKVISHLYSASAEQLVSLAQQLTPLFCRYAANKKIETTTPNPKYLQFASSV